MISRPPLRRTRANSLIGSLGSYRSFIRWLQTTRSNVPFSIWQLVDAADVEGDR